jgi:hypothetical protein
MSFLTRTFAPLKPTAEQLLRPLEDLRRVDRLELQRRRRGEALELRDDLGEAQEAGERVGDLHADRLPLRRRLLAPGREDPLHGDEAVRKPHEERADFPSELHAELGERLQLSAVDLDLEGGRVDARLPDRPDDLRQLPVRAEAARRRDPHRETAGWVRDGERDLPRRPAAEGVLEKAGELAPLARLEELDDAPPLESRTLGAEEPPRHRVRAPDEARGVGEDDAEREDLREARRPAARSQRDRRLDGACRFPGGRAGRRDRPVQRRRGPFGGESGFAAGAAPGIFSAGKAIERRARSLSSISPSPRSARSRRESRSSSRFGGRATGLVFSPEPGC